MKSIVTAASSKKEISAAFKNTFGMLIENSEEAKKNVAGEVNNILRKLQKKMIKQCFSKWRGVWIDFKKPPTAGQLFEMKKYNYKLR